MANEPNVVSLTERVLGECPVCREPVIFAQNFIRTSGAFVHVRCTLGGGTSDAGGRDFPRPAPPPARGA